MSLERRRCLMITGLMPDGLWTPSDLTFPSIKECMYSGFQEDDHSSFDLRHSGHVQVEQDRGVTLYTSFKFVPMCGLHQRCLLFMWSGRVLAVTGKYHPSPPGLHLNYEFIVTWKTINVNRPFLSYGPNMKNNVRLMEEN